MSVEVKTPTRTQFEHTEFHCGEKQLTGRNSPPLRKFSFADKNENARNQNEGRPIRKRRFSQFTNTQHQSFGFKRKRLKSMPAEPIVLPTKFLLGGNINDPLNLNSMNDEEIDRLLNEKTPVSSPLPTPLHRLKVEVHIPTNITDPLNLNDDDDWNITKCTNRNKKKRQHKNKKKGDASQNTSVSSVASTSALKDTSSEKRKGLMEALRIDIDDNIATCSVSEVQKSSVETLDTCITKTVTVIPNADKIVSPVIPQISPGSSFYQRRRRTLSMSDARPEPSSSVTRSILRTSLSPPRSTSEQDKITPPKRFKKQFSHQSIEKAMSTCSSTPRKFPKKGKVFIYGNYNRYYGYRNPDTTDDHRLLSFQKEWFEGKDAIDIGCNVGHMTLTIAKQMQPRKIVGIDIDSSLIAAARKNVRHYISKQGLASGSFPISNALNYGPIAAPPIKDLHACPRFPHNVAFVQGNYVLESDELLELQKEDYDVILALSLTKWVHLNFGDEGLKRMFKRIYRQLRPGGRLILEPQPWSSYKKRKKLTPEIFLNFHSITLKPDQFSDYLLSKEVGFSTCEVVDTPFNKAKGFRRTIQLFTKAETAANSPKEDTSAIMDSAANTPAQTESAVSSPKEDTSTIMDSAANTPAQTESAVSSPKEDTSTITDSSANTPAQTESAVSSPKPEFSTSIVDLELTTPELCDTAPMLDTEGTEKQGYTRDST